MKKTKQMTIAGFEDAVGVLMGLRDRFGYGHCAVCLDDLWCVRDLTAFTDVEHHDADTALDWASCAILNDAAISKLVLLSCVTDDVRRPREDEITSYGRIRAVFGERGVEVLDWILYDGENFRSMAFTVDPDEAWGGLASEADQTS